MGNDCRASVRALIPETLGTIELKLHPCTKIRIRKCGELKLYFSPSAEGLKKQNGVSAT